MQGLYQCRILGIKLGAGSLHPAVVSSRGPVGTQAAARSARRPCGVSSLTSWRGLLQPVAMRRSNGRSLGRWSNRLSPATCGRCRFSLQSWHGSRSLRRKSPSSSYPNTTVKFSKNMRSRSRGPRKNANRQTRAAKRAGLRGGPVTPELRAILQQNFGSFLLKAHGERLDDAYIPYLAHELAKVARREVKRLIVNLPPRHLKTFASSICLPAFVLGRDPSAKIMIVTYGENLAVEIADRIRRILRAPWYQATFKTRISRDHARVSDFATTAGGGVYAAPIGGQLTGYGADYIIIDDPLEIKDAENIARNRIRKRPLRPRHPQSTEPSEPRCHCDSRAPSARKRSLWPCDG